VHSKKKEMIILVVSEFIFLDGVIEASGGKKDSNTLDGPFLFGMMILACSSWWRRRCSGRVWPWCSTRNKNDIAAIADGGY